MHIRPWIRSLRDFFTNNKPAISFGLLFFAVGISLLGGTHFAFAQETTNTADASLMVGNLILTTLTWIINYIVIALGKVTLMLIQIIIIPILNYNSFSTSPIIGLGWSLVRDVMNMFVIVALIFIAIFTIVGDHRAHWEQQLPQLFIAVVLMNFSRTICGILIDISQVIMFTFVNALLDIAAGNFTQLFQLQDFGKMSEASVQASITSGQGITPFVQFTEAFLQIPLYGSIVAILFLLALAFLYRIVLLWILVILSPMTFFMGGIKGIFHGAEHSAANWWGKFTGALMMGPILTFFLWLSLAAASSGSISTAEGFEAAPPEGDTFFSVAALDSSHLTSLLLALILLTVGMQVAGEQSQKVGGMAQNLISDGMGKKVVGGAITLPFRAGRTAAGYGASAAGYGARTLDVYGGSDGKTIREGVGGSIMGLGKSIGERGGFVGAALGQSVVGLGARVEEQGEHLRDARTKAAKERVTGMTDEQKVRTLQMMKDGKASGLQTPEEAKALQAALATDKKFQKEARIVLGDDEYDKQLASSLIAAHGGKDKLDDAGKAKLFGALSENLDVLHGSGGEAGKKIAEDLISSDDLVVSKLYDKPKIFDNPELRDKLSRRVVDSRKDKEGNVVNTYVTDRAASGSLGQKVLGVMEGKSSEKTKKAYEALKTSGNSAEDYTKAIDDKKVNIADVTLADMQGPKAKTITEAIASSKADINRLGEGESDPAAQRQVTQAFINNLVTSQKAGTITKAFEGGKLSPGEVTDAMFTSATPAQRGELVRGAIGANINVGTMPVATQNAFAQSVADMRTSGDLTAKEAAAAHGMLLGAGKTLTEVLPGVSLNPAGPAFSSQDRAHIAQLIKEDVSNVRHLAPAIMTAPTANEATKVIVENTKMVEDGGTYSAPAVTKIAEQIASTRDARVRAQMREGFETLAKAVALQRNVPPPATETPKQAEKRARLEDLHDQIQTTMRTLP